MITQNFADIYTDELAKNAILNEEFKGFREDYLILHCLLSKHQKDIKRFFEIGTNMGTGTKIIKNALGKSADVFSLDLPIELAHSSLHKPGLWGKKDLVGHKCNLPFTQLRGDSLKFNYSSVYPIDAWFIDGEHDYEHAKHESNEAIKSKAKLIIWHDSDILEVARGISEAIDKNGEYNLYRVIDTRIAYAVKKS